MINKEKRLKVYKKYNGHCAYCGCKITLDDFQIDHVIPKSKWMYIAHINEFDIDNIDNLMPTCSVCNHYKRALDLETFRRFQLGELHKRIKRIPKNPRTEKGKRYKEYMQKILDRYGISENKPFDGVFYFEKIRGKK